MCLRFEGSFGNRVACRTMGQDSCDELPCVEDVPIPAEPPTTTTFLP